MGSTISTSWVAKDRNPDCERKEIRGPMRNVPSSPTQDKKTHKTWGGTSHTHTQEAEREHTKQLQLSN